MSTRAIYGFTDGTLTHWVFVHHDGYPSGAAQKFAAVLNSKRIWQLPRFEADEFAAGFVAANKDGQGSIRLSAGPDSHGDTEYCYVVSQPDERAPLQIVAYDSGTPAGNKLFSGFLTKFIETADTIEA